MAAGRRRRVLVVAEGATLAHFAGGAALADALPADRYETTLACPGRYRRWVPAGCAWRPLHTLEPSVAYARMDTGRPLYDRATLEAYIDDDLNHLAEVRPELVIGDGRLSLGISAREAGIPYVALAYAAWHPGRAWRPVMPCLRWTRYAPMPLLNVLYGLTGPSMFGWHAGPIKATYDAHGVAVAGDLRSLWTDADLVLYADLPSLYPEVAETPGRRFIGPVIWSPPVAPPKWWDSLPTDRPVAYVSVGSSGDRRVLPKVLAGLRRLDLTVMVATAGRLPPRSDQARVFAANYLPGGQACARADLVVSNGGALTTAQAIMAAKPLLGVCTNLDQFLEMQALGAAGAGLHLRADRVTAGEVAEGAQRLMQPAPGAAAEALRASVAASDLTTRLTEAIAPLFG